MYLYSCSYTCKLSSIGLLIYSHHNGMWRNKKGEIDICFRSFVHPFVCFFVKWKWKIYTGHYYLKCICIFRNTICYINNWSICVSLLASTYPRWLSIMAVVLQILLKKSWYVLFRSVVSLFFPSFCRAFIITPGECCLSSTFMISWIYCRLIYSLTPGVIRRPSSCSSKTHHYIIFFVRPRHSKSLSLYRPMVL